MFGYFKQRRRDRIRRRPFPPAWRDLLVRGYALYSPLPTADRQELEGHILVFLAEKRFEGCGGQEITDEVRVEEKETVLDTYGARNPAEFFAVATECFFEQPGRLKEQCPSLHDEVKEFYRQDPLFCGPTQPQFHAA